MTKWAHSDMLQNGPAYLRSNAVKMLLVSTYASGDSYATVQANKIAEVSMSSTDYVFSASGNNQLLTTASGKSGVATAGSGATPNLHIAFTDGSSKVIFVTDETTDQVVTNGNPLIFPSITITASQPA